MAHDLSTFDQALRSACRMRDFTPEGYDPEGEPVNLNLGREVHARWLRYRSRRSDGPDAEVIVPDHGEPYVLWVIG